MDEEPRPVKRVKADEQHSLVHNGNSTNELYLTPSYAAMIGQEFKFFDNIEVNSETGLPTNISRYAQQAMRNGKVPIEVDYACASTLLRLHRLTPVVDCARDAAESWYDMEEEEAKAKEEIKLEELVRQHDKAADKKKPRRGSGTGWALEDDDPEERYILRRHRVRVSRRLGTPQANEVILSRISEQQQ